MTAPTPTRPPSLRRPAPRLGSLSRPGVHRAPAPGAVHLALCAGCLAVAALTLLLPSQPTYDPWAWIIWGREITELDLVTTRGPSWKPLPVLFTAPFALLGEAAPEAWLVVARAGGLLALAFAYRLGARIAGRWAGGVAVFSLLLADQFIRNFWRGNSEGLLVALCLWAIERHLDGRRSHAFAIGFGAALLRPEVWPFWGLYGLWLAWRDPRARALVGGCFAGCAVLWFVPEWLGSGNPLRAAERARQPNPDSAAFAAIPFLEVFRRSFPILMPPVLLGAAIALVRARRDGDTLRLALGAAAGLLMLGVAAMTQFGFAGNLRYVALPAALVAILAGAGWVELVRRAGRARGRPAGTAVAAAIVLAAAPFAVHEAGLLERDARLIRSEAHFYDTLPLAIERAGGAARVKSCGAIYAGPFIVPVLAWYLHVPVKKVEIFAFPPGTTFAGRFTSLSVDPRFPRVAETAKWIVGSSCPDTS